MNSFRRLSRDDTGLTLAELLVTIALLSVLMGVVVTTFVQFNRVYIDNRAAADNTSAASIAMNEITRVIRSGTENPIVGSTVNQPVFSEAGTRRVVMQSYLDTESADPRPVRVRFEINASRELVETRWAATPVSGASGYFTFASRPLSSRVVARRIELPSTIPNEIFTYLDKNGVALVIPTSGQLTETQRRSVVAVQVRLTVQTDDRGQAKPATLHNTVGIPNLGVSRVQAG